jgi:hypothetical protein
MVVASTVVTLNAVNIHVGNLVAVSTVGNLRAVNALAGSLVAANIPVGSMVAASTVNAAVMVTLATERERQRYARQLSGALSPESCLARRDLNADFKDPVYGSPDRCRAPWRRSRHGVISRTGATFI